jgi:hypothetical protein
VDGDLTGDACDTCTDTDADGWGNPGYPATTCPLDNCPSVSNASQTDGDTDGVGNVCDNCPTISNSNQADPDTDGKGSVCDNCPNTANANQADGDADGVGNVCDNCPTISNTSQADPDTDGKGSACDNCPNAANPGQQNFDGDGNGGDACDPDDDNDGVLDDGNGDGQMLSLLCLGATTGCDDCDPYNNQDWAMPGAVMGIYPSSLVGTVFSWPALSPAAGTQVLYSVLRGELADLRHDQGIISGSCYLRNMTATQFIDTSPLPPPQPGDLVNGWYYLVGAENDCRPTPTWGISPVPPPPPPGGGLVGDRENVTCDFDFP